MYKGIYRAGYAGSPVVSTPQRNVGKTPQMLHSFVNTFSES